MSIREASNRHRLALYFGATFAWSWSAWAFLFVLYPEGMEFAGGNAVNPPPLYHLFFFVGGLGPSAVGLILTGILDGRSGLSSLFGRLKSGFRFRWALFAAALPPVLAASSRLLFSVFSDEPFPPINAAGAAVCVLTSAVVGFLEEFGWRGIAYPALRSRFSPLISGIALGAVWSFWHLEGAVWATGNLYGPDFPWFFLAAVFGPLTAYALLMAFTAEKTGGNMATAIVFHASLASAQTLFLANAATPRGTIAAYALEGAVLMASAAGLFLVGRDGHRTARRPIIRSR